MVGNTELGVEVKVKRCNYPVYINPCMVKKRNATQVMEDGVKIGASVTLTKLEKLCDKLCETLTTDKIKVFSQIKQMLRWFAGKQIRNIATIGGNIMPGSPISDLNPYLWLLSAG